MTAPSGIGFHIDRAAEGDFFMPESLAAGAALFDYDGDGDLDVYAVNGYRTADGRLDRVRGANRLYRRDSDGRYVDVSEASGLADPGYGMGVALGDIDNDGDLDVYVTNYGPDALYRNRGDGTFEDISAVAGIAGRRWGASAAFFDYDGDGLLDLFVTNYVRYGPRMVVKRDEAGRPEYDGPQSFPGVADVLYHNEGGGRFSDVSERAGLAARPGRGLGVAVTDLDGDGRPDVYVANDREANFAWLNRGGVFEERAAAMGLAVDGRGRPEASMGIALGDVDMDGDLDLLLTHFARETHTLYLNVGRGRYADMTSSRGLAAPTHPYTGWGAEFADFDHDGDLDLAILNGRVLRSEPFPGAALGDHWNPYAEPNQLFENTGRRFRDASRRCGAFCSDLEVGRGLVAGDVDDDGDLDLLVSNGNGTLRLYRNDVPKAGHWLQVRARDPALRRDAVGAAVRVRADGWEAMREITHVASYFSASGGTAHFGLGPATRVEEVRVRWPDGSEESFGPFAVDRRIDLAKGAGRPP